ncbi:MAG: FAD:protein FMN transferase [Candidatus Saccharibacteria bacterium]
MPISIDIPGATSPDVFQVLFNLFKDINRKFSPYLESSEVSLFSNGDLQPSQLTNELKLIIDQSNYFEKMTDGYFSTYYAGMFDPSGYVKAWAIDTACSMLTNLGYDTFLINIAGDMVAHGDTKKWNLAIQDPFDKHGILGTVQLSNQSIATSGSYIRDSHIIDPHTGSSRRSLHATASGSSRPWLMG